MKIYDPQPLKKASLAVVKWVEYELLKRPVVIQHETVEISEIQILLIQVLLKGNSSPGNIFKTRNISLKLQRAPDQDAAPPHSPELLIWQWFVGWFCEHWILSVIWIKVIYSSAISSKPEGIPWSLKKLSFFLLFHFNVSGAVHQCHTSDRGRNKSCPFMAMGDSSEC